jgi:shikimate kinase
MNVRAVFLVGFMAAGKTTVGQELAQRLGWEFVDLDAYIEEREKQSIRQIFAERGEPSFRELEHEALRELRESLKTNAVIALGGGTFAQTKNRELLRPFASVFLEAHPDELWERSQANSGKRPLRGEDRVEFERLYQLRVSSYREATVTIVTSGKDPTSLCMEIERRLMIGEDHSADGSAAGKPSRKKPMRSGIGDSQ